MFKKVLLFLIAGFFVGQFIQAPAYGGTWEIKEPLLWTVTARAGVIDRMLYVHSRDATLQVYDPDTDSWAARTSAHFARSGPGTATIDGKLYVVGGCINTDCRIGVTNILERYDPAFDTWEILTPMPTPRGDLAAGAIDGKLYVIGGFADCGACVPLNKLEVYDPATDSWDTTLAPMPTGHTGLTASVLDGKLYAVGGNQFGTSTGTVELYDPVTDTWDTKSAMPTARVYHSADVIDGQLLVTGGWDISVTPAEFLDTLEIYNPSTDTWMTDTPMPAARLGAGAGVIDGKLYVAGGFDDTGILTDTLFVLTMSNTPVGGDVTILPEDPTTGETPVTLIFDNVTVGGNTTVTTSDTGTPPPSGFRLGSPPVYYEISTTAEFSGQALICIDYNPLDFAGNGSNFMLMHREDTDADGVPDTWVDRTCTPGVDGCPDPNPDTVNHRICAIVTSFSEFAILEPNEITVDIDIKPGSYPNSVNLTSNGVVTIAILTTQEFDARDVDTSLDSNGDGRVSFSGASAKIKGKSGNYSSLNDVDNDGDLDLVIQFNISTIDPSIFEVDGLFTIAVITGETVYGTPIRGWDTINIVKE